MSAIKGLDRHQESVVMGHGHGDGIVDIGNESWP